MQLKAECPECKQVVKVKKDGDLYKHECDDYVPAPSGVISPSGFNTYKSCERKFWFAYGPQRIREPPTKYTIRGTMVHKICEDLWSFVLPGPENWRQAIRNAAKKLFDDAWDSYKSLHKEGEAFKQETWMMVDNHVASITRVLAGQLAATPQYGPKGCWTMVKPRVEEEYYLEDHGMRGRVDEIIVLDDDEYIVKHLESEDSMFDNIIISDLKTSKVFKIAISTDYEIQIHYYALMHYLKTGKYPRMGVIKYLRYGTESYFNIRPELVHQIHEEVYKLQQKIKEDIDDMEKWNARTDYKFCAWCSLGQAEYDSAGNVIRPAICQAGWKEQSDNGAEVHGVANNVKYVNGVPKGNV